MHLKARKAAFGGLLLALAVIFMWMGSVLETSTMFFLAASSYFVGITVRESGLKNGAVFYFSAVILGFITAPNKFYVITFAAMGFYIWGIEAVWRWLDRHPGICRRRVIFIVSKFLIFNIVYIPGVLIFQEFLFGKSIPFLLLTAILAGGQVLLIVYDRAYEYAQSHIWERLRKYIEK